MTRPVVWLALVTLALLGVRALSATVVSQPGYTDAYYYAVVAERLARGEGLTADFVWNFMEAPQFAALPVASHRFWMPLASVVPALGIAVAGGPLGEFRAGQLALILVAGAIPVVTYAAARSLGAGPTWAIVAAIVAGLGGAFAPGWVSIDSFGIAAVLGTCFFLAYAHAARGSVRAGLAAGIVVGLLHLARAEGALFGLALLPLLGGKAAFPLRRGAAPPADTPHRSLDRDIRRAGAVGIAVAIAIGLAWVVRGALLALPQDLLARAVLLVHYEDLYALEAPTLAEFLGAPLDVIRTKLGALATNAITAAMSLLLVLLVPIGLAVLRRRADPAVVAFVALGVLIYLAQSLVFTLHSVRGSFFHSVAAFFPFAVALAAAGAEQLFAPSTRTYRLATAVAAVGAFAVVSAFSVAEWDVSFNTPYRARVAALPLLPPGPLVVTDAAAWRWISGREAVVAPADGPRAASCAAEIYLAESLVLEPAHFSAYNELYDTGRSEFFRFREERDGIRVYVPERDQRCIVAGAEAVPVPAR